MEIGFNFCFCVKEIEFFWIVLLVSKIKEIKRFKLLIGSFK